MSVSELKPGVVKVNFKQTPQNPFNLSVVRVYGATGIFAYALGSKRPRTAKHMMLDVGSLESWLNDLEIAQ
jgi:hypothetical protein